MGLWRTGRALSDSSICTDDAARLSYRDLNTAVFMHIHGPLVKIYTPALVADSTQTHPKTLGRSKWLDMDER